MSTTVYLIRHAEAEGNVYRRCHGIYDSLLTEKAWTQLPYLAKRFENVDLDAVYASHLYRARHTANAIAQQKNMKVLLRKDLHEINMGKWEDYPWAELGVVYPDQFELWRSRPWDCVLPEGESVMQAGDRVLADMHKIAKQHDGKQVAVVSHGSAIRSILCRVLGLPEDKVNDIGWGDNTCVAKLIFDNGNVKAEYWNDASHLPEKLSTFAAIGWKDNKGMPTTVQIWFKEYNPEDKNDNELLIKLAKQEHESDICDISDDKLIENAKKASKICKKSVCFGMLDDKPVAVCVLYAHDDSIKNVGRIGLYGIDKEYTGCGISQQLIGHSMSVYRNMGKKYLCIDVPKANQKAYAFYESYGFKAQNGDLMLKNIYVPSALEQSEYFEIIT